MKSKPYQLFSDSVYLGPNIRRHWWDCLLLCHPMEPRVVRSTRYLRGPWCGRIYWNDIDRILRKVCHVDFSYGCLWEGGLLTALIAPPLQHSMGTPKFPAAAIYKTKIALRSSLWTRDSPQNFGADTHSSKQFVNAVAGLAYSFFGTLIILTAMELAESVWRKVKGQQPPVPKLVLDREP
jgi:hypothetical protein